MRISILFFSLLFAMASVTWCPRPTEATTIAVLDDAQLVGFSDLIARVTILDMASFWYDDRTLLTRVRARVSEVYQGECGEELVFYVRGGRIDDITQTVGGEFEPAEGASLVVFLEKIARYDDQLFLTGLSQGAFIVDDVPMTRSDQRTPVRVHRNHVVPCLENSRICAAQTLEALRSAISNAGDSKP